jgi:putative N6-adenine-specific DNA methylase
VKDAIVDQFRDKFKRRPDVDKFRQDLRVNIYCKNDDFIVSLDSSGDSLHRRGYKLEQGPAPISEVLAAGLILLSGWDKESPFIDPMCGSGTIVLEAALMARNIPAGNFRKEFGFQRWPNYNKALWEEIKEEANAAIKPRSDAPIYANEIHKGAWRQARENIGTSGLRRDIELIQGDFFEMPSSAKSGVLIMNPPYGERLQELNIEGMYSEIGDAFKKNWHGWNCWILSSNTDAMKNVGLKSTIKIPLFNGKLECRFVKYEMYQGSKE